MASHIPFITGESAARLVSKIYGDSKQARVPLDRAAAFIPLLPPSTEIWIDPGVDGFDDLESRRPVGQRSNTWFEFMQQLPGFSQLGDPAFWVQPKIEVVKQFVFELLDLCAASGPSWITIPQLPIVNGSARNKINRMLGKVTGEWRASHKFGGCLILPIIFTHQDQINGKTERNPHIKQATRIFEESHADGFWAVDKTLPDDSGSKTLRNVRLPAIVCLHEELNNAMTTRIRIAGPYWGMNLVLWAKGLIDYPAIGVGNAYQYYLTGGHTNAPSARVAIPALRRRVGTRYLGNWIDDTIKVLGTAHPLYSELFQMRKQLTLLNSADRAREQVARFYKNWFDLINSNISPSRPLALFQDLSAAYALGKSLPDFKDEGTARRPEAVVEPLMLNCL